MNEADFFIALLDDRKDPRETVIRGLRPKLPKGWDCIECPLLADPLGYGSWLRDHRVLVLLVDQLLDEQANDSDLPVDYKGHDVIRILRKEVPEFPIIVVTRAKEDHDLQNHFGDADDIVDRTKLLEDADQYVTRIVRLGHAYLAQFEKELAELSELSQKTACGKASADEISRLRAIQAKLGLSVIETTGVESALQGFEAEVGKLERLRDKAERLLRETPLKKHPIRESRVKPRSKKRK